MMKTKKTLPVAIVLVTLIAFSVVVLASHAAVKTKDKPVNVSPGKNQNESKNFTVPSIQKSVTGSTSGLPLVFPQSVEESQIQVVAESVEATADPAADYQIPWQSVNSGGNDLSTSNYRIMFSVGQSAGGFGTSTNYQTGIGYWYGATGKSCDCGSWGDVTGDGNINPVDVVFMVNRVYLGNDMVVQHPNCPRDAADVNCDGNVNPVDVVFFVNRVYLGNDMFCADPCS